MVTTARAVGLVQKADGMDARSAATPRNDSKQSLTAEMSWRTSKAARIDECPMASWTQGLPSTSFQLMKAPLPVLPDWRRETGDQARARISTQFLFPP
jgi:hypothetical protein